MWRPSARTALQGSCLARGTTARSACQVNVPSVRCWLPELIEKQRYQSTGFYTEIGIRKAISKQVDHLAELLKDASDDLERAHESTRTIYFNEEAAAAKKAVDTVIQEYSTLLKEIPEPMRSEIRKSNAKTMELLQAKLDHVFDHHAQTLDIRSRVRLPYSLALV